MAKFSDMLGKTLDKIEVLEDREILFRTQGKNWTTFSSPSVTYRMFHEQDCCEDVHIEDVCGDLNDLIGEQLLVCEEVTSLAELEEDDDNDYRGGCTWTFYKLSTNRGSVTIRWVGRSNGWYSEKVSFEKHEEGWLPEWTVNTKQQAEPEKPAPKYNSSSEKLVAIDCADNTVVTGIIPNLTSDNN